MQGGIVINVDCDALPLTIASNGDDEVAKFAHGIADRLSKDIAARYGLMARIFKPKKLEFYVLDANCHIDDDSQTKNECRVTRIHLPHDDAFRCEIMRDTVAEYLPNVVKTHKLPFGHCDVEVREVGTYTYDYNEGRDRYGKDLALHITLSK